MKKDAAPTYQIHLRALEPEDVDLLYRWENDPEIWRVSNTHAPFSKHVLQKYIESSHHDIYELKQLRLMIDIMEEEKEPKTVGAIDLFDFEPFHQRAGIGILVYGEENQNRGYATAALKELIQYAFSVLQLHQLYCNISTDNEASIRLFERAGFELAGTKKDWIKRGNTYQDEAFLQLITHN
ncbi:MAG: GNAT family N-acetyltransferase [Bacteroidales bacterium]|nr:GNAT family N-acetyltransferase [Bacteroidales bacterium]